MQMASPELLRRWEKVRARLDEARAYLLAGEAEQVQEWLDHNELGLALDDLETVGLEATRQLEFWEAMASAAALMEMPDRAAQLRARV
jgi:hypothetical protein